MGQPAVVVIYFMGEKYIDKEYWIFTDNYYNFVKLTEDMTTRKTYITAALNKITNIHQK